MPGFVLCAVIFGTGAAGCQATGPVEARSMALYASPWIHDPADDGYSDSLRALIVLVKFRDDDHPGDPALRARGWPLYDDPTTLPPFARTLLAPSPAPPFADSTLTAYFFDQSRGRFLIFGDVYDEVVVSRQEEAAYHKPRGGFGALATEVLDRLDASGVDFSRYDYNRDGRLDQVFMILRRDAARDAKKMGWTGISCLDARCGGQLAAGPPLPAPRYDGIDVDWNRSGSWLHHRTPGNIDPQLYHVRLMAHELGHDLWASHFNHLSAITTNDVPLESNRGRKPTNSVGYALMAGAGGGMDCGGSYTISAYERERLGWIRCDVLDTDRDSVRLGDLYATSTCVKIPFKAGRRTPTLYLSHHQRIGYFDRYRRGGDRGQFEIGLLRTTGLLVMMADGRKVDVIPADGSLYLGNNNAGYEGDLFGPETGQQLTPWTRPNSNGFFHYPRGYRPAWMALDDIRYGDDRRADVVFDYVEDFRTRPVIREDSWMGAETERYRFTAPLRITNRSTLTIETELTVAGGLHLDPGSRLHLAPGSRLTLPHGTGLTVPRGAEIIVEGTLVLADPPARSARSRVKVQGDGQLIER